MKKLLLLSCIGLLLIQLGCVATSPPKKMEPAPQAVYSFSFNPPQQHEKSGTTIGIVSPKWDENIGTGPNQTPWFDAGIMPKPNEFLQYPNLTAHASWPPQDVLDIYKAFGNAVKDGIESIMIARGFDVMGPFDNVDEMTYPQKNACNLIIIPEFSQTIRSTPTTVNLDLIEGTAVCRTEVVLNIYDPLSKEKLWIKKFTTTSDPFPYKTMFAYEPVYQGKQKVGYNRKGITWDNRAANFAKAEEAFYAELMQKAWDYFNPEEMMVLKGHSDELRKKKRF